MKQKRKRRVISDSGAQVLGLILTQPRRHWYGYEILKQTGIHSSTLYVILKRLESQGVLRSSWERINPKAAGRPPRRMYKVASLAAGRELLDEYNHA
jgi:PadR family transcriptional regulator, regulatory protein PadR